MQARQLLMLLCPYILWLSQSHPQLHRSHGLSLSTSLSHLRLWPSPTLSTMLPPLLFLVLFFSLFNAHSFAAVNSVALHPSDASSLVAFKSQVDLHSNLPYSLNTASHFCQWLGVTCFRRKVVRVVLRDLDLGGSFAPDTLSHLDQLRVLSLQNNSITGPLPDFSKLLNLKSLFLDHNSFSGSFPLSLRSLHRLRTIDLSCNNLTGSMPAWLTSLDRLYHLRLDSNRFSGSIPPLNQSSLKTFNVSRNNFSGAVPVTPTLLRFDLASFLSNPNLCGEIIHRECHHTPPFFASSSPPAPSPPPAVTLSQSAQLHGVDLSEPSPSNSKHKRTAVIIGFSSGVVILIGSLLCFAMAVRNRKQTKETDTPDGSGAAAVMQIDQQESELEEKVKRVQGLHVGKSGNLVFCAGEAQLYTLDQLMRGSAELLGRGSMGTTYKAVLDNRLIVCVKRLDAAKLQSNGKDSFEQHMESVGGLRHPNLVPLRAFFQAREERLLIYDYQPNGSLFSLIHGSKSTRAKPLHWTSCLKIAEDVAQGLSYIHQAWRLVHGNLKSSNVLLGPDFEACIADYCLAVLAASPASLDDHDNHPDAMAYKAPETRNSARQPTSKSDVFSFGILLLELISGKPPPQLPILAPDDMMDWVRSAREDYGNENDRLEMLLEVAMACSVTSPEQRPTMWQVLKMLQEIKETVLMEDSEVDRQHIAMP